MFGRTFLRIVHYKDEFEFELLKCQVGLGTIDLDHTFACQTF